MRAGLLAIALLGACYSPSVAPCVYQCAADMACPDGLSCNQAGMCSVNKAACNDQGPVDGGGPTIDADPNDHTAPTVTLFPINDGTAIGPRVKIEWQVDDPNVTLNCTIDNQPTSCSGTQWVHSLPEGQHSFSITATDVSHNTSPTMDVMFDVDCQSLMQLPSQPWGMLKLDENAGQAYANRIVQNSAGYGGSINDTDGFDPGWTEGRFGHALSFPPNNAVFVTWPGPPQAATAFTIELWLNLRAMNASNDQFLVTNGDNSVEVSVQKGSRRLQFRVDGLSPSQTMTLVSGPITLNDWHFITASFDGQHMKFFIDGGLPTTADINRGIVPFEYLFFGARFGTASDAIMDELAFGTAATSELDELARYCPLDLVP